MVLVKKGMRLKEGEKTNQISSRCTANLFQLSLLGKVDANGEPVEDPNGKRAELAKILKRGTVKSWCKERMFKMSRDSI